MESAVLCIALASGVCTGAAIASPKVDVQWGPSEHYIGADLTPRDFERAKSVLTEELQNLGTKYLKPDQNLTIEVVDMGLAGHLVPRGSEGEMRVLTGRADWPRFKLRYDLQESGRPVIAGQESIADMSYLTDLRGYSNEPFRFEQRLLEDWFKKSFVEK
ncbi:MAG: DUF3016 domain-containing protein [Burkholderiaceae bacterium]